MEKCYEDILNNKNIDMDQDKKMELIQKLQEVSKNVECVHKDEEPASFINYMLEHKPEGVIVEAGCYKGGGTAKFSLLADALGKKMFVFDSFEGLPSHNEAHKMNIYGKPVTFSEGEYASTYDITTQNVKNYGAEKCCTFVKGWFEDTFDSFHEQIAGAYIDVDLVKSVKECMIKLYPLLTENGVLYCHDGHLPLVIELLEDEKFWNDCVHCSKPEIIGLGTEKLLKIIKKQ